jgi:hypothetical protein
MVFGIRVPRPTQHAYMQYPALSRPPSVALLLLCISVVAYAQLSLFLHQLARRYSCDAVRLTCETDLFTLLSLAIHHA